MGAVGPPTEEGAASAWTPYFRTVDADATAGAVEQAGGSVRVPPTQVFTAGRTAGLTDPTGAEFAVWEPGDTDGLELVDRPGSVSRIELCTTDAAAAKDFYRTVLSWDTRDLTMGSGAGIAYTPAGPPGGGERTVHGDIMQLPAEHLRRGSTSEWRPYFEVEDCDATVARAQELGATAIVPAVDTPGAGRLAMLLDPFGAPFAVIAGTAVRPLSAGRARGEFPGRSRLLSRIHLCRRVRCDALRRAGHHTGPVWTVDRRSRRRGRSENSRRSTPFVLVLLEK